MPKFEQFKNTEEAEKPKTESQKSKKEGQEKFQIEEIRDGKGNKIGSRIQHLDAAGRVVGIEEMNNEGEVVFKKKIEYNHKGQISKETFNYKDGVLTTKEYSYDSRGRIRKATETNFFKGEKSSKTTEKWNYDTRILRDGTILEEETYTKTKDFLSGGGFMERFFTWLKGEGRSKEVINDAVRRDINGNLLSEYRLNYSKDSLGEMLHGSVVKYEGGKIKSFRNYSKMDGEIIGESMVEYDYLGNKGEIRVRKKEQRKGVYDRVIDPSGKVIRVLQDLRKST